MNATVDVSNSFLETKRLVIRPWKIDDLEDFNEYAKVDGVGQWAGWNPHTSIKESEEILSLFIKGKNHYVVILLIMIDQNA